MTDIGNDSAATCRRDLDDARDWTVALVAAVLVIATFAVVGAIG